MTNLCEGLESFCFAVRARHRVALNTIRNLDGYRSSLFILTAGGNSMSGRCLPPGSEGRLLGRGPPLLPPNPMSTARITKSCEGRRMQSENHRAEVNFPNCRQRGHKQHVARCARVIVKESQNICQQAMRTLCVVVRSWSARAAWKRVTA